MSHLHVRYVTKKYWAAVIVFNGYNGDPTTKDATHLRRTGDCVEVTVHFARGMMIKSKRDEFMKSKANKQHFIHYLSGNLDRAGCIIYHHANDDADVLIFHTGFASARHNDSVLIGNYTVLLVLLLHQAEIDAHRIFLKSEHRQSSQHNVIRFIEQSYSSPV